jgi:hypothetical protein
VVCTTCEKVGDDPPPSGKFWESISLLLADLAAANQKSQYWCPRQAYRIDLASAEIIQSTPHKSYNLKEVGVMQKGVVQQSVVE